MKSVGTQSKKLTTSLLLLSVLSLLTACASGTTRTEGFQIDAQYIEAVKRQCSGVYPGATRGTIEGLWDNKRLLLRRARECAAHARVLAELAENRNRVIQ